MADTYNKGQIEAAKLILSDPKLQATHPNEYAFAESVRDSGAFNSPLGLSNLAEEETDMPVVPVDGQPSILAPDTEIGDVIASSPTAQNVVETVSPYVPDVIKKMAGIAETATTFGTGAVSLVPATIGFYSDILNAWGNKKFMDNVIDAGMNAQERMAGWTYTPRTEAGQDLTAAVSSPFLLLDTASTAASNFVIDMAGGNVTGGLSEEEQRLQDDLKLVQGQVQEFRDRGEVAPDYLLNAANTMWDRVQDAGIIERGLNTTPNKSAIWSGVTIKALIDSFPDLYMQGGRQLKNRALVKEFRNTMDAYNIDLGTATDKQILEWTNVMNTADGKPPMRGETLAFLQEDLQLLEQATFQLSKQFYKSAEEAGGFFDGYNLTALERTVADLGNKRKWNVNIPKIVPILEEFEQIVSSGNVKLPDAPRGMGMPSSVVPPTQAGVIIKERGAEINDIWKFREKINQEISDSSRSTKRGTQRYKRALLDVKNVIDEWMDSQFEADTIAFGEDMLLLERNSPSNVALSKWFIANDWYNKYKENFSEQKVVDRILKNDLTAKSVTNMLLGFNAANFKSEAANVVKTLRNIFPDQDGQLSPQLQAIKTELKLAVFDDLITPAALEGLPDTQAYKRKYLKFKSMNKELIDELFTPEEMTQMDLLYKTVQAQERVLQSQIKGRGGLRGFSPENVAKNDIVGNFVALQFAGGNPAMMKAAFQANLIRRIWNGMKNTVSALPTAEPFSVGARSTRQRQILSELYGQDLRRPLRSIRPFTSVLMTEQSRLAEEEQAGRSDAAKQRVLGRAF